MRRLITLTNFMLMLCFAATAYAADSIKEMFTEGKPYADIRLRYEHVEQDGLINANSKTARIRPGFNTGEWMNFKGAIEGEGVFYLGNDDYNDTVNRRTDHATVADPENVEVNQAYGEFTGISETVIKAGRQQITVDDHRFIGDVGWRQNNQVYDAAKITNKSMPDTTVEYGYIYNVNRIFGEQSAAGDWGSKSHYYNISNTSTPLGKIATYGYFLDFGSDSAADSNQTLGGFISGEKKINDKVTVKYYGEYAQQSDYGDNATDYSANYYRIAPSVVVKDLTTTVGYEVLGSDDGNFAFRTPLATLHKFNGWADKFLTTPATGLQDFYVSLAYKIKDQGGIWEVLNNVDTEFVYHDFDADDGGLDHGNEVDIFIKKPINEYVSVSAKYANYNAKDTLTDTQKIIFDVGIKF